MTRSTSDTMNRRLERTPRLEAALAVLRTGLVRRVLLHGLGTVAVVGVVWLLFAFLADWGLRVPKFVRVFHGLAFVGLVGGFAWHALVRPWRRVPGREGLAILFERAKPELRQLLVSAVQFQEPRDARAGGDPELIERVLAAADDEAGDLDPGRVLDDRGPRRRVFAGVAALAVGALLGASQPTLTGIFFARLLGRGVPWPQRTTLTVLIPLVQSRDAGGATVVPSDGRIDVRIARGTDVPILVRADGVVPDEVVVNFDGGRDLFLATSSGGVFRTLLRSCQEDVRFWVTGGDDNDGLPRVHVHVLEPPDVEGLAIEVQPPDYSDLEPARYYDRDVEVLAGSRLRIAIRPSTPEVNGVARILPDDRVIALEPVTFPLEGEGDDEDEPAALGFEWHAERSFGFRIELVDPTGLANPDPGLVRVDVVEDRPPEIQVYSPSETEFDIVAGGALPLVARVEDDFGIQGMGWGVRPLTASTEPSPPTASGSFELRALERDLAAAGLARGRQVALGRLRLEVSDLGTPEAPVAVDQVFELEITARDNRRPEAGVGRAIPRRARVVRPEDLLRRLQDRLARARLDALTLSEIQREKRSRVEELSAALDSDGGLPGGEGLALAAALAGQRRVSADATDLARDLAAVAQEILYGRLDPQANALLEAFDRRVAELDDPRFPAVVWRLLAAETAGGRLGRGGFAGHLVELVDLALEIAQDHAAAASLELDTADRALDGADRRTALANALTLQTRALERIDVLLERLSEWDNYQSVLALARDILNRQRTLKERTQQFAAERR